MARVRRILRIVTRLLRGVFAAVTVALMTAAAPVGVATGEGVSVQQQQITCPSLTVTRTRVADLRRAVVANADAAVVAPILAVVVTRMPKAIEAANLAMAPVLTLIQERFVTEQARLAAEGASAALYAEAATRTRSESARTVCGSV